MYADLESLKSWLRVNDPLDDVDDAELTRALQVASNSIDHLCSQSFALAEEETAYYVEPRWSKAEGAWVLDIPPLSTSDYAVFTWNATAADWTNAVDFSGTWPLRPRNGTPTPNPWTQIVLPGSFGGFYGPGGSSESMVLVRATFGWAEVPENVVLACIIQAARLARRRDAVFGIVNSLDGSEQSRLTRVLDPDVVVMLRGYIKYWAAR